MTACLSDCGRAHARRHGTLSHESILRLAFSAAGHDKQSYDFAPRMPVRSEALAPTLAVNLFDFAGAEYRVLQSSASSAAQAPGWLDALHRDVGVAFGAELIAMPSVTE